LHGFAEKDAQGRWMGLNVDLCRAVAATALGDAEKADFVPLCASARFLALQSGEIDLRREPDRLLSDTRLTYQPLMLDSLAEVQEAFLAGRCQAYISDLSQLAAVRAGSPGRLERFVILPELIAKEPLSPVVRRGDEEWFTLVQCRRSPRPVFCVPFHSIFTSRSA
jgi:general L-amino acid transport system substrate-binding protein